MNVIYGIDLGKKGGIVVLKKGKIVHKMVMPLVAGEEIDLQAIDDVFIQFGEGHVVAEKFAGFFGYNKQAAISLAKQSGLIEGLLFATSIPYTLVLPKVWQKEMWGGIKTMKKADGKNDTKKTSLLAAKRLFPKENFLASSRCTKPHDGLIDAALLAAYGHRKGLNL